ncbi:hypothetical protein QQF64_033241 [Cirrhinus molitorella]|uniref:Uncharacterized protein n=1 Tax=Cirrhinus molitorella TaxID=172907 RepID=A0ABR3MTA9_9TELE
MTAHIAMDSRHQDDTFHILITCQSWTVVDKPESSEKYEIVSLLHFTLLITGCYLSSPVTFWRLGPVKKRVGQTAADRISGWSAEQHSCSIHWDRLLMGQRLLLYLHLLSPP